MITEKGFSPYQNEADSIQIVSLTIENRLDRVSLYGSIDLWKDKGGLEVARELKELLVAIVEQLEKAELPDKVELTQADTVSNPFT